MISGVYLSCVKGCCHNTENYLHISFLIFSTVNTVIKNYWELTVKSNRKVKLITVCFTPQLSIRFLHFANLKSTNSKELLKYYKYTTYISFSMQIKFKGLPIINIIYFLFQGLLLRQVSDFFQCMKLSRNQYLLPKM